MGADEVVCVVGKYRSDLLFMDMLLKECISAGIWHLRIPSPLSYDETETLIVSDGARIIAYTVLPADEKLPVYGIIEDIKDTDLLDGYLYECEKHLKLASMRFSLASEAHFALEDIYTEAMNFDMINAIYEKTREKIEDAFK